MIRRILIALTGTDADKGVLDHAPGLAVQTGASITLLWVIPIVDDGDGALGRQLQLELGSSGWRRKNRAEERLTRLAAQLAREDLHVETAIVVTTLTEADEIVRYAAENGHDLIAIGCDDRSWPRRWISGSPGDGVMRKATVPTLLVGNGARRQRAPRSVPAAHPVLAAFGGASL